MKNIIFDMGNVLLSYNPEICLEHFFSCEKHRSIIRRELFQGPEWIEGDLGLLKDEERFYGVRKRVPEKLHEGLKACTLEWDMCMQPVSGAREFCDYIKKQGCRVYVLSNASSSFYRYFPRFLPFDYFDGMAVSCDIHIIKPDIRIYQYLLEKYALRPEECFFIDDIKKNVEGAAKAGIRGTVFQGDFKKLRGLEEFIHHV